MTGNLQWSKYARISTKMFYKTLKFTENCYNSIYLTAKFQIFPLQPKYFWKVLIFFVDSSQVTVREFSKSEKNLIFDEALNAFNMKIFYWIFTTNLGKG